MKNRINIILALLLVIAVAYIIKSELGSKHVNESPNEIHNHSDGEKKQLYTCGMHPEIISEEPGNCPICEMKLTPIKENGESSAGSEGLISIDPIVEQNMNIKYVHVKSGSLRKLIRTNGILRNDERKEYIVNSRVNGWIEKLYKKFEGERIGKGEKILEIYSPELVEAQEEYLAALSYKEKMGTGKYSSDGIIENSIRKMKLLNMTQKEIDELRNSRKVRTIIPIYSPSAGIVMEKYVAEGERINKGKSLIKIHDLSSLWLIADLYEKEIADMEPGAEAKIYLNAFPEKEIIGKVSFIYPTMENKTRTVKVRIDISNADYSLKPSMLAKIEIEGAPKGSGILIPEDAIIRAGNNDFAVKWIHKGKYKPIPLKLGGYYNGYYHVTGGLEENEAVVSSAQFMIDSESRLKSAINSFSAHSGHNNASMENMEETPNEEQGNEYGIESPLIRTGVIDVEKLDKNGNGKLFECPMDWNIISDEKGRCPACEMKLKEYTLGQVKENLVENGYEHK